MSISQARTIAFDVLRRVGAADAYADETLRAKLDSGVKAADAGLATELVFGVLRWQRLLDFLVDRHVAKGGKLDPEVRIALRLGAYQLAFLDRVPARAAVNESVELVKRAKKRSAASLVNAVLRKIADAAAALSSRPALGDGADAQARTVDSVASVLPAGMALPERLGILYSYPDWMVARWIRTFGEERTRELLVSNNRAPQLSAGVLAPEHAEEARRSFEQAGCRIAPGRLLRDAWRLDGGNPSACEAVRRGWVSLQDEASQAVAGLLSVDRGAVVLDLCAAPGGKTLLLAKAAGPEGRVIAADLHEHRVRAMKARFEQCGVRNVETLQFDGTEPLAFECFGETRFDRVLVDVPCSGTGTLARHPEIRWKLREEDLGDLHARQARLLRNALPLLAPGGRLVYSTCSLEPEENEQVMREVLGEVGGEFTLVDPAPALKTLVQESVAVDSLVGTDLFFRTFPPQHGTDGFFAAVITRSRSNT